MRHPARAILRPLALAALIATPLAPFVHGAIEATSDAATLRLPAPSTLTAGPFTLFLWLHPDAPPAAGERAVLTVPGAISITLDESGTAQARILRDAGGPDIDFALPAGVPQGEWTLLTLSFDAHGAQGFFSAQSDSLGFRVDARSSDAPFTVAQPTGNLALGANDSLAPMRGVYALVVARNHAIGPTDAQAVFATRQHFAPFELDNTADSGAMSGPAFAIWMINHTIATQPVNATGIGYTSLQLAAQVDNPARVSDFTVFSRLSSNNPDSFRVVRTVAAANSLTYRSPFEVSPGFFARRIPGISTPLPPNPVAGISPLARRLAERAAPAPGSPPMRVVASANSRGVKNQDGVGNPATFAHGFTLALRDQVAGIMLRPARVSFVGPYFGLRSSTSASEQIRRSPDSIPVDANNFSRFFTGQNSPTTPGPGEAVRLPNPGSFYSLRARPEPGSLLREDRRLAVRAYLLAYPGASDALILADAGPNQSAQGAQTPLQTVTLDTSSPSRTFAVSAPISGLALDLPGDLTAGPDAIVPGLALTVANGPARSSVSVISSAFHLPGENLTRVVFEHPLEILPLQGDTVLIGEYRYEVVEHVHDAAQPGLAWRGLEIRHADDESSLGVIILAFDAFNPDDGGFVIGQAGWAGNGYDRQLDRAFRDSHPRWIAAAQPDLWFQFIAHQNSAPSSMTRFLDMLRAAAPGIEAAWIGCVEYESTVHSNWQRYILENASTAGVAGLTVLTHPTLGSFPDAYADGVFIDSGHVTARGNTKIALAALDMLRTAARWPGDANNDGAVTFADINAVLSNFGAVGPSDGSLPGDVTLDGAVNFADINAVLSNFGTSAHD